MELQLKEVITGFIHVLWAIKHYRNIDLYLTAVRPDMQKRKRCYKKELA
jgi:hypothetical protein